VLLATLVAAAGTLLVRHLPSESQEGRFEAGSGAWPPGAHATHANGTQEFIASRIQTKLISQLTEKNLDRTDLFLYTKSIFLMGPFDLVSKRSLHGTEYFDAIIPLTMPTTLAGGPGYITSMILKVWRSLDFDTNQRAEYSAAAMPVKIKNFEVMKTYKSSQNCPERLMPIFDIVEYKEGNLFGFEIPLPYGVGFGPGRPDAIAFPHEWEVWLRIEDMRTSVGTDIPTGSDQFLLEYQLYWTEDQLITDAHRVTKDAMSCPVENTRYSLELGPAAVTRVNN